MADQPLTLAALARFHQEIAMPDVGRVVREEVGGLRDEMHSAFDALAQRLDRLETEYHMIVAGLKRVEEKLDRAALKSELLALKARVEALERELSEPEA